MLKTDAMYLHGNKPKAGQGVSELHFKILKGKRKDRYGPYLHRKHDRKRHLQEKKDTQS